MHVAFTNAFYTELISVEALWFVGTGLAFVFLGLFNLSLRYNQRAIMKTLCVLSNLIALAFSVLVVIALGEAQAYIAVAVLLFVTVTSLVVKPASGADSSPS
jgi:hypothetical protein